MNIVVKNLSIQRGLYTLIQDLSFELNAGDRLAIIGEEGNGKSTLLEFLYNSGETLSDFNFSGKIFRDGEIGYVRQATDVWRDYFVYDFLVNDSIDSMFYSDVGIMNQVYKNLSSFNLNKKVLDSKIGVLSGGEFMKLKLLKEFSKDLDIILLDEPTNDLDIQTIEVLEQFVKDFSGVIVFVSHDINFIKNCANRILHIELLNRQNTPKATFYEGSYDDYVSSKLKSYEKSVHQARNERVAYLKHKDKLNNINNKAVAALKSVSRSNPHKAKVLKKTVKRTKKMIEQNERTVKTKVDTLESQININFLNSDVHAVSLYSLNDYCLEIDGKVLIENINIELLTNNKYVIVGENGCGKTTLIKKVAEDLKEQKINYFYLAQKYEEVLNVDKSAFEFIHLNTGVMVSDDEINNVLTSMNLDYEEINSPLYSLSEGQKAKVILSLLSLKSYDIIILDELTRNISPLSMEVVVKLLKEYHGTILAISHDRYFIEEVFNKIVCVENKQIRIEDTI